MHSAAATCFGFYAVCHAVLAIMQCYQSGLQQPGSIIVVGVALTLVWDNGMLATGHIFFPNAPSGEHSSDHAAELARLVALSQPRFYAHAFLTPILAIQAAVLGAAAGVPWLDKTALSYVWLIFGTLSALGTLHHVQHPDLVVKPPHPNEPPKSWMRAIVQCTLADKRPITLCVHPTERRLPLSAILHHAHHTPCVCIFAEPG